MLTDMWYLYTCKNARCSAFNDTIKTRVTPGTFPSCTHCRVPLTPLNQGRPQRDSAETTWAGYPLTWGDEG